MCMNIESSEETSRLVNDLVGVDVPIGDINSNDRVGLDCKACHGSGLSAQSVFHLMTQSVFLLMSTLNVFHFAESGELHRRLPFHHNIKFYLLYICS